MRRALLALAVLALAFSVAVAPPVEPTRVEILPDADSAMAFLFRAIPEMEWAACLEGRQRGDVLVVERVYVPHQTGNSLNEIQYADCEGAFGFAHSHPLKTCTASTRDREHFLLHTHLRISLIRCGEDRNVYLLRTGDGYRQVRPE